jgi:hypothetical protein
MLPSTLECLNQKEGHSDRTTTSASMFKICIWFCRVWTKITCYPNDIDSTFREINMWDRCGIESVILSEATTRIVYVGERRCAVQTPVNTLHMSQCQAAEGRARRRREGIKNGFLQNQFRFQRLEFGQDVDGSTQTIFDLMFRKTTKVWIFAN